jgi:hypothetical protein
MIFTKLLSFYRRILPNEMAALLFYASLAAYIAIWNVNIFINDEVTLAAQLFNLGKGTLWIETAPAKLYEGLSFGASPPILGFTLHGHLYAFYTHAVPVFATPFYAFLYLISVTVGIRLFFAALWSLSLFMVIWLLGRQWGRPRLGRDLGILIALAMLVINGYLATRLPPLVFDEWGALMAIQLFNILATLAILIISLRIFTRYFADSRVAEFGAVYILIATPLTFWAVSGKDHTASVLLIVASIWSLYVYLLDGKKRYRYLSYALVGVSFWVRVFDAVPLFIAIILTDSLTSKERTKAALSAVATVLLAMAPYFVNNCLLFGNPFLSPVYVSARPEIAQQASGAAANIGSSLLEAIQRLPMLFFGTWNLQSSPSWPENLYHVLFYVKMPLTLSLFQICPLLIVPLWAAIPYVAQKLVRLSQGQMHLRIDRKRAIAGTFFIYITAHLVIYAPIQDQGFGLDMRYYLPLYIPLLFFTLASIQGVLAYPSRIARAFSVAWGIFMGVVLVYVVLLRPPISDLLSILSFPFIGTLGVVTAVLMALFVPYVTGRKKLAKELAILVGFATFVSSYWLAVACLIWQKTPIGIPRPGLVLPIMEIVHRAIISALSS